MLYTCGPMHQRFANELTVFAGSTAMRRATLLLLALLCAEISASSDLVTPPVDSLNREERLSRFSAAPLHNAKRASYVHTAD